MPIERLDHVNVRAADLAATRDFYTEIIGLQVGDRPPFEFPGYWLYADRIAVIHLTGADAGTARPGGSIDHIAFRAAGLSEMRDRLARRGVGYEERIVPGNGELQIFLHDPNGVAIELTFTAAEVARRSPASAAVPA